MKVKELIELLQKQDPEMEVLSGDLDDYYYDPGDVEVKYVSQGREVDEDKLVNGKFDADPFSGRVVVIMAEKFLY
jgi:hypothetical protein